MFTQNSMLIEVVQTIQCVLYVMYGEDIQFLRMQDAVSMECGHFTTVI